MRSANAVTFRLTSNCFYFQADATLEMEQRDFIRAGLEYVCLIQEVQERKKFEFVETVSEMFLVTFLMHVHTYLY